MRRYSGVLINLVPEFLSILEADDREDAYRRYLAAHRSVLSAYWRNYVLDLDGPLAGDVIARTVDCERDDLRELVSGVRLDRVAEEAMRRAEELLQVDTAVDVYLMVGVGAANAGELVVDGRGVAFICVEHFTGRANPTSHGLGLAPALIPAWIGHEISHLVRYTSPNSRSPLRRLVAEAGGNYDYWETGRRASLRELLLNEGLAVHAAQVVAPGFDLHHYFGYPRRHYQRLREMEATLRRLTEPDLDRTGLGLRLRYLSGGMSPAARLVGGRVVPERAGYYLGSRMAEALIERQGIAEALRASPEEFAEAEQRARGLQTA